MDIHWLYNRLKLMPLGEILYRIRNQIMYQVEAIMLNMGWQPEPKSPVNCANHAQLIDQEKLNEINPEKSLILSERLATGRIHFFNYPDLDVNWPINWHRDPLMGVTSNAKAYGKTLDYRNEKLVGDSKVIWELGRHQFLIPIAACYFKTKEDTQLNRITEILSGWLSNNPFGLGVQWCSSLEIALRGMSWCLCHEILKASGMKQGILDLELDQTLLKKQIYQHAFFIKYYLSKFSSANNHLIGELSGLHILCSTFEFGEESKAWQDFAWQGLQKEMTLQVFPDGVNKEQAIHYHAEVFEYFLVNLAVAKARSANVEKSYLDRLEGMYRFLVDLSPRDESNPPQIGDADDGTMVSFPEEPLTLFQALIASYEGKNHPSDPNNKCQKLSLYKSIFSKQALTRSAPHQTQYPTTYHKGGYAILGEKNFHLIFDAGPLGYPEIAAHGHADALSFCLAIDGDWWILDPGTYAYHTEEKWRSYFRGSTAHNILVAAGKDQSDIAGAFMWSRKANAQLSPATKNGKAQSVSGVHDGYRPLGISLAKRNIELDTHAQSIKILDTLNTDKPIEVDFYFHFHPDISAEKTDQNQVILTRGKSGKKILISTDPMLDLEIFRGNSELPLGWYSSCLGHKTPTTCTRFRTNAQNGSSQWVTNIALG